MKKKYEKDETIIIISWIFIFIVIVVGWILLNKEIYVYKKFAGILYTDTALEVTLNKSDTKLIQRNSKIFVENNLKKINIIRVEKDVLKRNNVQYNKVFLDIGKGNGKTGDVVEFSMIEKRVKVANIFKIIWDGDNNNKSK